MLTSIRPLATIFIVGAMIGETPTVRADSDGEWVELAPMSLARQECGAARIGNMVYVVGGLVQNGGATNSVEAYDIDADAWSAITPLPQARHHMGVAAVDGKLYVIGGLINSEVFVYDPAKNEWSSAAPLPEPRGACWAVAHRGRIYVFGGIDQNFNTRASTLIYDPVADEWSQGRDMPTAREHLTAVAAGDFIYVIGGRRGGAFNSNERYDPVNDEWATMAPMPTARSAMAVAAFGRRIVVSGGEVPRLFEITEVYDIVSDTWECNADMPLPRHGLAAVTLDDRILMPAGGIVQGLEPTNFVDSFVPPDAMNGDINSIRMRDGTLVSGGLTSIFESDDTYVETEARVTGEVAQPHLMIMRLNAATEVENPTSIDITIEGRITDLEAQTTLRLRDFANGGWDQVDQFSMGMSEEIFTTNAPDAGDYVRASDGRIRLEIEQIVFFPFTLGGFHTLLDHIEIVVR